MSTYKRFHQPNITLSVSQYVSNLTAHLPVMMRQDIDLKIGLRKKRRHATDRHLSLFAEERVRYVDKVAHHFVSKFPFGFVNHEPKPLELTHEILINDEAIKDLANKLTVAFVDIINDIAITDTEARIDGIPDSPTDYYRALHYAFEQIRKLMLTVFIEPPSADTHDVGQKLSLRDAETILECAIRRCIDPNYLVRKFKRLRKRYIEHAQITLGNVGKQSGQHRYVSRLTLSNFKQQLRESDAFMHSMVVISHETMQEFNLAEVASRTTANLENRRIELVVRSRGDEERAIDMGFDGVFITWTLPSKYHRTSPKWDGSTVKEAHNYLMSLWKLARAHLAKNGIPWFGLRVAEPHKDGTPHAHMFLYAHPSQIDELVRICQRIAQDEDNDELINKKAKEARFQAKFCDPSQGSATGYIIKYISKNINGAHMPEGDAEDNAVSVRAWASTWGIKQFSQSGSPSVGLWRQLRRANKSDVAIDEELMSLHDHADNSRWKEFSQHIGDLRLAYEEQMNQYGETTKRVIGLEWLGHIIETCSERFSILAKSDVDAWRRSRSECHQRGGAPSWSTENKCNPPPVNTISPLEKALMDVTGWSVKGVQCLIRPLGMGAKIPIDKWMTLSIRNGQLCVT
ncbi:replication endonuclease [Vibrio mediterranei]|uniref:replication endonuclease n=1 Tax=Vibrio mediterranei TaxID=689 RepID=UPI001EFC40A7|nr:replication endonuclease [Vibrio mediterranei]MCG9628580.1 replication endonuclease [Vibrio mediterranei]